MKANQNLEEAVMRRLDRKIESMEDILGVLGHCQVCRLALASPEGMPYVVPLNFGYAYKAGQLHFYMHCAKEGQKLDMIRANPFVCFEADNAGALISGPRACNYSQKYESVIAFGKAEILNDPDAKEKGLEYIMQHQSGKDKWQFDSVALSRVEVICVQVDSVTGKRHL
ncbi:MAG: pyridoxamine 5'-phosphate oxidase family protein [Anaerolineaceae bacterium]|nr:pyridoxamine 5'-phosphate oxidase family protein [Anaerolineaceae bacterium]